MEHIVTASIFFLAIFLVELGPATDAPTEIRDERSVRIIERGGTFYICPDCPRSGSVSLHGGGD